MSKTYSTAINKKQNTPKVHFEEYLYHSINPKDDNYRYSPTNLEAEFHENGYGVKHRFRHIAQRFRNRYS